MSEFSIIHFYLKLGCGPCRSASSSSAQGKEAMEKYGVQVLVLAHKYRIGWLKRECEIEVGKELKPKCAIDVLQIARLCDASRLYQKCLSLISRDFDSVLKSDAWGFVQRNDPRLELQILLFLQETEQVRTFFLI